VGTDEDVIMGIDEVCSLALQARLLGRQPTDDLFPNVIKMKGNQMRTLGEVI
jgi:serine protease AprX